MNSIFLPFPPLRQDACQFGLYFDDDWWPIYMSYTKKGKMKISAENSFKTIELTITCNECYNLTMAYEKDNKSLSIVPIESSILRWEYIDCPETNSLIYIEESDQTLIGTENPIFARCKRQIQPQLNEKCGSQFISGNEINSTVREEISKLKPSEFYISDVVEFIDLVLVSNEKWTSFHISGFNWFKNILLGEDETNLNWSRALIHKFILPEDYKCELILPMIII
jgi:hypothetical protein